MLGKLAGFFKKTGKRRLFAALLLICLCGEAGAKNGLFLEKNPVIARVGFDYLRLEDIEDKQINQLRRQLYEILSAKTRRATVDRLAKKYPEFSPSSKVAVDDREVSEFYHDRKLQNHGSLKQLTPQIRKYLEEKALVERYEKLYEKALKKGLILSYLKEPDDLLITMAVESAYLRGNKKAGVILLEFSDYQCPYCSRVQKILSELRKKYKDEVLFGYRHLPLSFHQEADEAAMAAECARDQGKFDVYHAILFQNQRKQRVYDLKQYARRAGIKNPAKFDVCLDKKKYKQRVENDLRVAAKFGINGAPGFVIGTYDAKRNVVNGEIISGAQPKRRFAKIIEKYLKKNKDGN